MDFITVFLVVASFGGLILQYWKNEPAFSLITEILAVGGLVTVIQEYTASNMEQTPALVFVIAMVGVMIWSAWNMALYYMPNGKKRR